MIVTDGRGNTLLYFDDKFYPRSMIQISSARLLIIIISVVPLSLHGSHEALYLAKTQNIGEWNRRLNTSSN
jgi:hypothetical protein